MVFRRRTVQPALVLLHDDVGLPVEVPAVPLGISSASRQRFPAFSQDPPWSSGHALVSRLRMRIRRTASRY